MTSAIQSPADELRRPDRMNGYIAARGPSLNCAQSLIDCHTLTVRAWGKPSMFVSVVMPLATLPITTLQAPGDWHSA